jgi:hypothetical protein
MRKLASLSAVAAFAAGLGLVALIAGCSTPVRAMAPGQAYSGEVWTWDEKRDTITLRRGGEIIRVKVSPDQLKGLRLHEVATVRGELDGPVEIERVMTPPPTAFLPQGTLETSEVTGRVVEVDATGKVAVQAPQNRIVVWEAKPSPFEFRIGDRVRVRMSVQALAPAPPGRTSGLVVSPPSEPGDYAVVTGAILAAGPAGTITVESPRGPIIVLVDTSSRYRPADVVRVRTSIHPAS